MLTSTYSLVAIAAEHDRSRGMLARLRQHLHSAWKGIVQADLNFLETTCQRLAQFDNFFHRRKIETCLMPVMRMMGREAQSLVGELESLAARAASLLDRLRQQMRSPSDLRATPDSMRDLVSGYCETVSCRLEREERELLPLSRRLLSVEDWFSIAARMLADDGGSRERARRIILPRGVSAAAQRALGTR